MYLTTEKTCSLQKIKQISLLRMFGMNSKKNVLIIKNSMDKFLTHTNNMSLKNHGLTKLFRNLRKIVQVIVLRRCNMEQIGGDYL
jgi:ribosome biogenesis protein Tsr3